VSEMYDKIITMCWSIKEVNRNLADREDIMVDYSISYLNKTCSKLSDMLTSGGLDLEEKIDVVNKAGVSKALTLGEVADMLNDAKKIIEFNLIDNVNRWAQSKSESA